MTKPILTKNSISTIKVALHLYSVAIVGKLADAKMRNVKYDIAFWTKVLEESENARIEFNAVTLALMELGS